jgi:hypothetical protein
MNQRLVGLPLIRFESIIQEARLKPVYQIASATSKYELSFSAEKPYPSYILSGVSPNEITFHTLLIRYKGTLKTLNQQGQIVGQDATINLRFNGLHLRRAANGDRQWKYTDAELSFAGLNFNVDGDALLNLEKQLVADYITSSLEFGTRYGEELKFLN